MFTVDKRERATVVTIDSELDARNAQEAKEFFKGLVAEGPGNIVVDLSQLAFVDSSGLGALVSALKLARQQSCTVRLCAPTPTVSSIFQLTRLDRVFEIFASVDEALENL